MSMQPIALANTGMQETAAVLKINSLDLMFAQGDIRTLESASDVDGSDAQANSVGWINYMRQRWPVYCLSEQLELLASVPDSRRTCALLALEGGYVGVLCDDASIIKQLTGQLHDIPVAMKAAHTPVQSLFAHKQGLLCASNAKRMAAYIEHLVHRV